MPPLLPAPNRDRAEAFLSWLEGEGLTQVYWHFDELTQMSDRFDEIGLVGVAREVAGMAAAVEHICNALGCNPGTLIPKLRAHWQGIGGVATLIDQNTTLTRTSAPTFPQAGQNFLANLATLRNSLQGTPDELVARDLLTTVLIRNHSLHNGLPAMNKSDLIDLFVCMLRAAFLTWHAKTPTV